MLRVTKTYNESHGGADVEYTGYHDFGDGIDDRLCAEIGLTARGCADLASELVIGCGAGKSVSLLIEKHKAAHDILHVIKQGNRKREMAKESISMYNKLGLTRLAISKTSAVGITDAAIDRLWSRYRKVVAEIIKNYDE